MILNYGYHGKTISISGRYVLSEIQHQVNDVHAILKLESARVLKSSRLETAQIALHLSSCLIRFFSRFTFEHFFRDQ